LFVTTFADWSSGARKLARWLWTAAEYSTIPGQAI
jgi:hypothetical protein